MSVNDRDEQRAWELLGQHKGIEPSFGFAERTLRRLEERPARAVWQLPVFRWATSLSLAVIVAGSALYWNHTRNVQRAEVYVSAAQDSLEDYDVIVSLDQLNGDDKL